MYAFKSYLFYNIFISSASIILVVLHTNFICMGSSCNNHEASKNYKIKEYLPSVGFVPTS